MLILAFANTRNHRYAQAAIASTDLTAPSTQTLTMMNGDPLIVTVSANGTVSLTTNAGATATVITPNVRASNGIVHIINGVLVPAGVLPPAPPALQTITSLASGTSSLSTLTSLLVAANLTSALNGSGNFTVFAPNNAAFAAVPSAALNYLSGNVTALTQVLLYHVYVDPTMCF